MTPLVVAGMHGLGDNLHQRSVVRELARRFDVWLETSWPCVYWDMPDLKLLARGTTLRTQLKNAAREASAFTREDPPRGAHVMRVHYPPTEVRRHGSVLKAMSAACGVPPGDFRLPVRAEWSEAADELLGRINPSGKPLMLFRPLVERVEWTGGLTRNPDPSAYVSIFERLRDRFFVVSVADLVRGKEWTVGPQVKADAEFHGGELDIETILGLVARAKLVYCAPGFGTVMAQAIGTPGITVFGGYEDARSFSSGAQYTPWLPIEPIKPCPCWVHRHACDKRIDLPRAFEKVDAFVEDVCLKH